MRILQYVKESQELMMQISESCRNLLSTLITQQYYKITKSSDPTVDVYDIL